MKNLVNSPEFQKALRIIKESQAKILKNKYYNEQDK